MGDQRKVSGGGDERDKSLVPPMNQDSPSNQPFGAQIIQGDGRTAVIAIWLAVVAVLFGGIGFTVGLFAYSNTTEISRIAADASRAAAKAETATARANVSELYAKQLFTEMNRLGYPIRTPAEEHAPQQPDVAIPENPQ